MGTPLHVCFAFDLGHLVGETAEFTLQFFPSLAIGAARFICGGVLASRR
jgi:hypothetical protein